jgi:hypothetical protein
VVLQLFVKHLDTAGDREALQSAANQGMPGKTTEVPERGTKQKTVQALSVARGGDFVLWGSGPGMIDYDTSF